mgnify:CR=1 FL=1
MKAYKRFNKDMTCKGFQYEEGKTYETDNAVLCNAGFHACENPLDCSSYYSPAESVIREVELEDVSPDRQEDSKVVAKKITIGAKLDVMGLCKAHFEYVTSKCTVKKGGENLYNTAVSAGSKGSAAAGYKGSAAAGDWGSAATGESGSAAAGYKGSAAAGTNGSAAAGDWGSAAAGTNGSAAAGDWGSAAAGNWGSAAAGYKGSAATGESGSAAAGYKGSAAAGYKGSAAAGDWGSAAAGTNGSAAAGESGIACVRGGKAKGGIGCLLVIAETDDAGNATGKYAAGIVDGKTLKPDTWYACCNGEFVEAGNE